MQRTLFASISVDVLYFSSVIGVTLIFRYNRMRLKRESTASNNAGVIMYDYYPMHR